MNKTHIEIIAESDAIAQHNWQMTYRGIGSVMFLVLSKQKEEKYI